MHEGVSAVSSNDVNVRLVIEGYVDTEVGCGEYSACGSYILRVV